MKRLAWSTLLLSSLAVAYDFQSPESIAEVARTAVAGFGSPGVEVTAIVDSALRMPRCAGALEAHGQAAGTIEVACPGDTGWRLYVPVKVRRLESVVVLKRAIATGEVFTADTLAMETRNIDQVAGPVANAERVAGYSARHYLAAGSILTSADILSPRLVRRGDAVTLLAKIGGVEVRAQGKAMGDGGAGDRVSVENQASRRTMRGQVLGNGEIEVTQ